MNETIKQNEQVEKSQLGYYLTCGVGIAFMFLFRFVPPLAPEITPIGMQVLGVFLGTVFLWSTVGGIIWPSLLSVIALAVTEYTTINAAVSSAMGSPVIWQMFTLLAISGAINNSGAGELIARYIISRKTLEGHPFRFSFVYMSAFLIVASFTNSTAMMFLHWTVLASIAKSMRLSMKEPYFVCMNVFTIVSCAMGGYIIPLKDWQLALCMTFEQYAGVKINYVLFIAYATVVGFLLAAICTWAMGAIFKVDMSKIKNFRYSDIGDANNIGHLNGLQLTYMLTMAICLVLVLLSNFMTGDDPVSKMLTALQGPGIFGLGVIVLCRARLKNGKPVMVFTEAIPSNIWGPIFLVAAAMPLASALVNEKCGFMVWISTNIGPLFAGHSALFLYIVVMLICLVLTNLASNTGIGLMMSPVSIPLAIAAGASMNITAIAVIHSSCMGLILPGASAIAAIMYGSEDLTAKQIIKLTSFVCVVYALLSALLYPVLSLFG